MLWRREKGTTFGREGPALSLMHQASRCRADTGGSWGGSMFGGFKAGDEFVLPLVSG